MISLLCQFEIECLESPSLSANSAFVFTPKAFFNLTIIALIWFILLLKYSYLT